MGKFISNIFLAALALGLSIFTGSRTLDLLAWALPAGQTIYQWLGLAAFELGMYFWSFYFINGSSGTPQRSISLIMSVFSICAVAISTIADMALDAGQSGKIAALTPQMQQSVIVFLGVTIALNVAAFLACKLMSVNNMRNIKEGQAEDQIYTEGLRAITAIAPSMAADAAPYLAQDWANRTWQRIVPGVQRETRYLGASGPVQAPLPLPQADQESVALYRDAQAARRAAPSAGLPVPVPANPPATVPSAAPKKRGGVLGFLGLGKREYRPDPLWEAQNQAGLSAAAARETEEQLARAAAPSEKTSNQVYREEMRARRTAAPASSVAAARRARRAARMRPAPAVQVAPVPESTPEPAPAPAPAVGSAGRKGGSRSKK